MCASAAFSSSDVSAEASGAWSSRPILDEVFRRDRQRQCVPDGLVEPVVGAVAQERWQCVVGAVVKIVPEFVVNGFEVLLGDLQCTSSAARRRRGPCLSRSLGRRPRESRGLTNRDRSQNVFGSGSNPSEVKNRSPIRTMPSGSILRAFKLAVRENDCCQSAGAISG